MSLELKIETMKESIKLLKELGKDCSYEEMLLKSFQNTIKENQKVAQNHLLRRCSPK